MWTEMYTPVGVLRIVSNGTSVTAIDFLGETPGGESRSVTVAAARASAVSVGERQDDDQLLQEAVQQLAEYFAGDRTEFELPLSPAGTPFQLRVWEELRRVPYGEVVSYGEVARRIGMSGQAARAVGLANGRNPVPVVIPCHRVVGADGRLTGYAGGTARKRVLLDLEQGALQLGDGSFSSAAQ
jgi:methylated-DNA-[protein]-cysteine S-methyltransferase